MAIAILLYAKHIIEKDLVMRSFNKQDIRNWTLTGLTLLTPMVVYGASQLGANGLYIFAPNTKIISAEVNENFVQLDDRIGVYEDAIAVGNGLVGIGTKNPSAMLTVQGSYSYPQAIFGYDASNGNGLRIRADGSSTHYNWQIDQQGVSDGLSFVPSTAPNGSTFSTAAMTLRNSGNVGIGTSAPTEKLEVYGTLQSLIDNDYAFSIREKTGDNFRGGIGLENDGNAFMDLWRDDGTITHISSYEPSYFMGGNVGIGTESPVAQLEIANEVGETLRLDKPTGAGIQFARSGIPGYQIDDNAGDIRFLSGGSTEKLRLREDGRIGIGTTDPMAGIEAIGSIAASSDASKSRRMIYLSHDGKIGRIQTTYPYSGGHTPLTFWTGEAERLRIDTNGNVGIGLTSPAYTLDVNGEIRAVKVTQTSDARLKRDIRPLSHALDAIQCLQGVSYYLRNPAADQGLQLGLIAQEVERCYPELVSTDPEGYKSVSYDRLVAPLIEAVKEQQQLIARQQQRLLAQEQALQAQQQLSAGLEARLARIEGLLNQGK